MTTSLASQFNYFQFQLVRYELPFIMVIGTLGNIANVVVFMRRNLRSNACSWYLAIISLMHIVLLYASCLPRIMAAWSGYDYARNQPVLCKIRGYLFMVSLILSRHFLVLISIDRWLVTSSRACLRKQSSPKLARRLIIGSIVFWSIFSFHGLFGIQSSSNGCGPLFGSEYDLFFSIYSIIVAIVPLIIMSFFTLLVLINIRSRRVRRIHPRVWTTQPMLLNVQQRFQARRNAQFIRLTLFQIVFFISSNLAKAIVPLYMFLTRSNSNITADQMALSSFFSGISFNLLYTYAASTFFVYTLASSAFREEFIETCKYYWNIMRQCV